MWCLCHFQLKPVEYLLGSTARLGDIIVLGLLTQLKEVVVQQLVLNEICLVTVGTATYLPIFECFLNF